MTDRRWTSEPRMVLASCSGGDGGVGGCNLPARPPDMVEDALPVAGEV
jgi:hypothetical protein